MRSADVNKATEVLEVGPGLGVLTRLLVKRAGRVVAVELDAELADNLRAQLPTVEVVNVDILTFDPTEHLEDQYTVVANLPYHITSPALRHLLAGHARRLVVMVQAEVAERIATKPGDMSALAVTIQVQAKVRIVRRVPATAFHPRPKVDSAILVLEPLETPPIARIDLGDFVSLVQAGFKQPRKTVANSLADGLGMSRDDAIRRLSEAGIEPTLRAQAVDIEGWLRLFHVQIWMLYRCYAKINLTLEILSKRPDGLHELASIVHTISLADDLRIEPAAEKLTRVEGLDIDPDTNLVSRAARLLQATLHHPGGAELSLKKRIPAAAGLGGGSSNAAATLVGLNTLWGTRLRLSTLAELAAELGSDVPFFVRGGAALMTGRGEKLDQLPPLIGQWLVLVVPQHDVLDKTRRLYGALSPDDFSSGQATARAADQLRRGKKLTPDMCVNGFQRAARAVFPGLRETWAEAEARCARQFHLSGAGPALFAFAENREDAQRQAAKLGERAQAVRTVKHARASTNSIKYA